MKRLSYPRSSVASKTVVRTYTMPIPPHYAQYVINGEACPGLSFGTETGYFHWTGDSDRLLVWRGLDGWMELPIERLGTERRLLLLEGWIAIHTPDK